MKVQFYVGMGLGAAAAAAVSMLMTPGRFCMREKLDDARQSVDQVISKLGGKD